MEMEYKLLNCRNSDYTQRIYSGKYSFNDSIYSIIVANYKIVSFFLGLINQIYKLQIFSYYLIFKIRDTFVLWITN
jgi:hypothetical protein